MKNSSNMQLFIIMLELKESTGGIAQCILNYSGDYAAIIYGTYPLFTTCYILRLLIKLFRAILVKIELCYVLYQLVIIICMLVNCKEEIIMD